MNAQARMIIGVLGALVIALAVTLGVVLAMDEDGTSARAHMDGDDSFVGMMQSMGALDSEAMLDHMSDVLGPDGFQRMQDHLSEHRTGGSMTRDSDVDQMMHQMMDGMMQHMPADGDDILLPESDEHHVAPAATGTPAN